jgi:hypothetical protein
VLAVHGAEPVADVQLGEPGGLVGEGAPRQLRCRSSGQMSFHGLC